MSYSGRDVWHQRALAYADRVFTRAGIISRQHGIEAEAPEVRAALRPLVDESSRIVRHKPDRLLVAPGHRTAYAEVKGKRDAVSDPTLYVEWDSWRSAALLGGPKRRHCFLVLIDCSCVVPGDDGGQCGRACWMWEIPFPRSVAVPMRPANPDWGIEAPELVLERIGREAAEISEVLQLGRPIGVNELEYIPSPNRSGTPFFSFQWRASELRRLDDFLTAELLGGATQQSDGVATAIPTDVVGTEYVKARLF